MVSFFGTLLILILPELPFLSTKIRVSSFFINSRNMALILRIWENFSSSGWAGGELALCSIVRYPCMLVE